MLVNSAHEATSERSTSLLSDDNLEKPAGAYFKLEDHPDIARLVDMNEVKYNLYSLSIPLYVTAKNSKGAGAEEQDLGSMIDDWIQSQLQLKQQISQLLKPLRTLNMSKRKPTIAICYDFDGTLIRGNMQENSFIPDIGETKDIFWKEVKKKAKDNDMDEVLSYMKLMLKKANEKEEAFSKESLRGQGESVNLFKGVMEWFGYIKEYVNNRANIEHYIISSGLDEMIKGSKIGANFKHIFASGFIYDQNGVADFPARSVNYTNKVQYLFRINKGIRNSWDNSEINKFTPEEERDIPFSQMIYIGDGDTDVPAMKMVNYKGGYSIAVFPPKEGKRTTKDRQAKKKNVEILQEKIAANLFLRLIIQKINSFIAL